MRAVFEDLGYHACTAKAMVEDQGTDDLCFLKDGDVETLCKNVKCIGGAAGRNNRGANLGHLVSQKAEMNIKLAAYYLRYSERYLKSASPQTSQCKPSIPSGTCVSQMTIGMTPRLPSSMKWIGQRPLMGWLNFSGSAMG